MHVMSAQLVEGRHQVTKAEITNAIRRAGGTVSRSGLKMVLTELSEGTIRASPRLHRVSPGRYTRIDE